MYKQEYGYEQTSLTSNARSNFVSKVFSIVGVQLLITTFMVGVNMYVPQFAKFQMRNTLFYWVSIIGVIASSLILCKFW